MPADTNLRSSRKPSWISEIEERLEAATEYHHTGHVLDDGGNWSEAELEDASNHLIAKVFGRTNENFYSYAQTDIANLLEAIRVKDEALSLVANNPATNLCGGTWDIIDKALAFDPTKDSKKNYGL